MSITVTNNRGSLFVYADGVLVADSVPMNRQRGFWNKLTKQHVNAPAFTLRNVRKNPAMVLDFLALTGTPMVATVEVA